MMTLFELEYAMTALSHPVAEVADGDDRGSLMLVVGVTFAWLLAAAIGLS